MPESSRWYYSHKALAELIAAAQYLDEETDSSSVGDRLFEAVAETCERIALFPSIGKQRDDLGPGLRVLTVHGFPYHVLYRIVGGEVEIARVLHERRDIKRAFRTKRRAR